VKPGGLLVAEVSDWRRFLAAEEDEEEVETLRRHLRTGRVDAQGIDGVFASQVFNRHGTVGRLSRMESAQAGEEQRIASHGAPRFRSITNHSGDPPVLQDVLQRDRVLTCGGLFKPKRSAPSRAGNPRSPG